MEELTNKLNSFYVAYKAATKEEERKILYELLQEIVQDIANLIMDVGNQKESNLYSNFAEVVL